MTAKGLGRLAQIGLSVMLSALLVTAAQAAVRAATIQITPISKIGEPLVDQYVTIKGTVTAASNFSKGFRFVVADESGQIDVTYFESVFDTLPKPALMRVGAVAQITGRVDEYEGKYSLVPNRGRETLVLSAVPTATTSTTVSVTALVTQTVEHRELGGLNNGDHGALIVVEGEVHSVEKFDNGLDVLIFDQTGTQKIRLYNVVASRVNKSALVTGSKVRITGKVRATRKYGIRIEPALPSDVSVIVAGAKDANSTSSSDAGVKQQVVPTATVTAKP